jgi:Leucine-rich repeat (LRR) protein
MKFTKLLSNLILENSRFQVLYDKLVKPPTNTQDGGRGNTPKNVMDFETLRSIIFADPTTKAPENFDIEGASAEDMNNVKVGKYTQWLLKNYVNIPLTPEEKEIDYRSPDYKRAVQRARDLFMEDLFKVTDDLKKYDRFKGQFPQDKRDINKLTVDDVYELTKDLKLQKTKASKEEKEIAKKTYEHPGGEIIFRGPNWTLIKIEDGGSLGKDAACFYGGYYLHDEGESRWCTSSPGLKYFNNYIKDGPLYVILPNDDKGKVGNKTGLPFERYQFHFPSNQFMDREDKQVNLVQMLNGPMVELKDFFKPEFAKGLVTKGGTKVEINYPDTSAGKFVALYGFNELFESLPDNIEHLIINNKSKDDIALDVPKSISRFTNLQALLLENIVKTLPENIGDLKSLSFIALPNNNKLEKLPETIADISNLAFINLSGCSPSLNIPTRLKEKLIDEGNGFYYLS